MIMVHQIGTLLNFILSKFNLQLRRIPKKNTPPPPPYEDNSKIMLNIGAGGWSCHGWTNLDYPTEWYKRKGQSDVKFTHYDIRNDNLPFGDSSVDLIYCNQVIEHIEDEHIQRMFMECYRVLKKDGVMRIGCPDAEFLYKISKYDTEYWQWITFQGSEYFTPHNPRNVDFLVYQLATPKTLHYIPCVSQKDYINEFNTMGMYEFFDFITDGLKYRQDWPGDHISYWTFEKMSNMLKIAGFDKIIQSKYSASCSATMKNKLYFDNNYQHMSLYVDVIK